MKHVITFYTDSNKVKGIHDIKVSFYDQDGMAYSLSIPRSEPVENFVSIEDIVNKRLAELNGENN
jgi:hypothetical protein